jgi:hypothetical protein
MLPEVSKENTRRQLGMPPNTKTSTFPIHYPATTRCTTNADNKVSLNKPRDNHMTNITKTVCLSPF